jgi:hypothetical protein
MHWAGSALFCARPVGDECTLRALKYCGGGYVCVWGRILIGCEYANMGYIGHMAQQGAIPPLFLSWPRGRVGGGIGELGTVCLLVACRPIYSGRVRVVGTP